MSDLFNLIYKKEYAIDLKNVYNGWRQSDCIVIVRPVLN